MVEIGEGSRPLRSDWGDVSIIAGSTREWNGCILRRWERERSRLPYGMRRAGGYLLSCVHTLHLNWYVHTYNERYLEYAANQARWRSGKRYTALVGSKDEGGIC